MTDADKLAYAIQFLRRKKTLGEITALADTVGAALIAGQTKVVITSSQMEGGGGSGLIEFEAGITGRACEALLAEAARLGLTDTNGQIPFSPRPISTTVVLGLFGPKYQWP